MTLIDSFNSLTWSAAPVILTLAGLEIILSADNAVVLAVLAKQLKPELQRRALFYGITGAFVLRFIAIFGAVWIIKFWFLQILGGGYLIWLAVNHLTDASHHDPTVPKSVNGSGVNFWKVVVIIELTDLAFAVDSVLAAVGVTNNILIIYSGAIIGLVAMRFAAVAVLKLLEKFPPLKIYAYVLVAWIGLKLMFQGIHLYLVSHNFEYADVVHLTIPEFWTVTGLITLVAVVHWLRVSKD
ncbi:MAG: hypothetical protein LBD30_06255 [Verrucomicrobiales bacterium]|jgi:YkoY family integral membrane protein|nr:hypothetical protein [Verrucomicrobiales bacterium]